MLRDSDLNSLLDRIDHRGYPAYKDTRGKYQFPGYVLSIDHVQGDPFAAPSKLSIRIEGKTAGYDKTLYDQPWKRVALQDHLLRSFAGEIKRFSFQAKGSGKSGLISIAQPGQEILERSACTMDPSDGSLIVRFEVGFPANGRTINARELKKILFDFLPVCVKKSLFSVSHRPQELKNKADLAEDQHAIRMELTERRLAAFVANGSILPRKSGVSELPMKEAVAFTAPESLEVELTLPHRGKIKGMGIPCGVTLIVGGGYHGKSTLLAALERGVYDHIAGDGREYVATEVSAMKLRAEDGRSIQNVDISMFIRNLPNGKDTVAFSTEDASGSTSQAANTAEAMESGAKTFLIDEDTSATNFMIRDDLMQQVVLRDEEPIIPFIDRVREIYEKAGVSTVLVAGSCGAYFHVADTVIQMKNYVPYDITERAKKTAAEYPLTKRDHGVGAVAEFDWETWKAKRARTVRRDEFFGKAGAFLDDDEESAGALPGQGVEDEEGEGGRHGLDTGRGEYGGNVNGGHGRNGDGYSGHNGYRDFGGRGDQAKGRSYGSSREDDRGGHGDHGGRGRDTRVKMKVQGLDGFSINRENVDVRLVEQIVDSEQLSCAALIVKYMKQHIFDGKRTMKEAVDELERQIGQKGFAAFCEGDIPGNLIIPRRQEIFAVLNRLRGLIRVG